MPRRSCRRRSRRATTACPNTAWSPPMERRITAASTWNVRCRPSSSRRSAAAAPASARSSKPPKRCSINWRNESSRMSVHRCGTVGIAGRPNTGKSSLLNRLVGQKLSIVSAKPQTTRHLVTGVLTRDDCQYVFIDAPGQQLRSRTVFARALNRRATEAARDADVALFVVEAGRFSEEDHAVLARIPASQKVIAVVNKIDLLKRESQLIPFLDRLSKTRSFEAAVPVSARTGKNLTELLRVIREALPEGPAVYPADQLTDRDERFFAAEL